MASTSAADNSSGARPISTLFHSITTEQATGGASAPAANLIQLPHIPGPLQARPGESKYWRDSSGAFRVDRGHVMSPLEMPPAAAEPTPKSVAAPASAPVPVARPISPETIKPRSMPAQSKEAEQVEQIAEYLRRRQSEIEVQHRELSHIARQHRAQLLQRNELQSQRVALQHKQLQLSVEHLRQQLLDLGHRLSTQLSESNPIFQSFEEACRLFHELRKVASSAAGPSE